MKRLRVESSRRQLTPDDGLWPAKTSPSADGCACHEAAVPRGSSKGIRRQAAKAGQSSCRVEWNVAVIQTYQTVFPFARE
jgi:hypothetical protein